MVSINKYLAFAIVASVLLGAAFAQTDDNPATQAPESDAAVQGPGLIRGLGSKLISGLKSASQAVFSHVPFLNHNSSNPAGLTDEETNEAASSEVTSSVAPSTEAPATEAPASEAPATEAPAIEAASDEVQVQAEEQKSEQ